MEPVLGTRLVLEPESETIADTLELQVHRSIQMPELMKRMCPVFGQPKADVRGVMAVHDGVEADDVTDTARSTVDELDRAVQQAVLAFDMDLPYDYGSLAFVGDYEAAQARISDAYGNLPYYGPKYRIYVDVVATTRPDDEIYDVVREMRSGWLAAPNQEHDRIQFELAEEAQYKLGGYVRVVFKHFADHAVGTVNEYFNDEGVSKVTLVYPNAVKAREAMDLFRKPGCAMWWILSETTSVPDALGAIERMAVPVPVELPFVLMGIASREEQMLFQDLQRTVTLSAVMHGAAHVIVQPDFHLAGWIPGDDMYMVLHRMDDHATDLTMRYSIRYEKRKYITATYAGKNNDRVAYVYVGKYTGESGHPAYICVRASLIPCISETIKTIL